MLAVGVFAFGAIPYPRLALLTPITYFVAILGDGATAAILLAAGQRPRLRSTTLLAIAFAVNGTLTAAAMAVLPLMPDEPPIVASGSQSGIWLFTFWHAASGAGALLYVFSRLHDRGAIATKRFVLVASAIAVAAVAVCCLIAFVWSSALPPLAAGTSLLGLRTTGVGPVAFGICVAGATMLFRLPKPSQVERAYAFSVLALSLDLLILLVGTTRYTFGFYSGRVLIFAAASFVLVSAIQNLLDSRVRLRETRTSLMRSELESAKRAERIRALWSIASGEARPEHEHLLAVVQIGTTVIRQGRPMFGYLSHIEEDEVVVDATAWSGPAGPGTAVDHLFGGARFGRDDSIESALQLANGTTAWSVVGAGAACAAACRLAGWRSCIGTTIHIERRHFFLIFGSAESMDDDPYEVDDVAYVNVVASFFANRFAQQQQFDRLKFQMEHDALTGLDNRTQFRKAIRDFSLSGRDFAVAVINLDGFRFINDREGHQIGDELLVEVGASLRLVDEQHGVARLSGDEFGVVLEYDDRPGLERMLQAYQALFSTPFHTGDRDGTRTLSVSASIGVACFPEHGVSPEALLRAAAVALDAAKDRGGATALIFDTPMLPILEARYLHVSDLATAIDKSELVLHYQPTFDLVSRKTTGAEALIRWQHPLRGLLGPIEFITVAERNGLIAPLTRWVLTRAIRDLDTLDLPAGFRCFINIAPQLLEDFAFVSSVEQALDDRPHMRDHLGIEITETGAMFNVARSISTLALFRSWGLAVAIDDFGTGYSSLSYLTQLSVDLIKIDKSFIDGVASGAREALLCDSMLTIARGFGITTLAEGIETEAQADWLQHHGCIYGQGYLIAKPTPFADFARVLTGA